MKKGKNRRCAGRAYALLLIFLGGALLASVLALDARLRPVIRAVVSRSAAAAASQTAESCVYRVLEERKVSYGGLVELVRGPGGRIEAVRADAVELSRIKAAITLEIADALAERREAGIGVPVGTLTGLELLSARGPEVRIKLIPVGYVVSDAHSSFESAGVNQTRHRISVDITVETAAVLPGFSVVSKVTTSCVLAETVLLGEVPEVYFSAK